MTLTQKQEDFCQAILTGVNTSEAYRSAYDASKMKDATIHRAAKELMDNPKVAARLAELRKPAIETAQITLKQHLDDLKFLRDKAVARHQYTAAISAEISRGRAVGHYDTKKTPPPTETTIPEDYTLNPDEGVPDAPIL